MTALTVDARVETARTAAIEQALRMTAHAHTPLTMPYVNRATVLPMLIFPGVDAVAAMEKYGTFQLSDVTGESWTQDNTAFAFGSIPGDHAWNIVVSWPADDIEDTGRCWFPRCEDGLSGCEHIGDLDPEVIDSITRRLCGDQPPTPVLEPYSVSVAACRCPIWQLGGGDETVIHSTGCTLNRVDVLAEMIA